MLFIYRSNVPGEVHRAALKIFHIASNGVERLNFKMAPGHNGLERVE